MSLTLLKQSLDCLFEEESRKQKQNDNKLKSKSKPDSHRADTPKKVQNKVTKKSKPTNNNKTEENIKRLLAMSVNTVKVKDAEKIVNHTKKNHYTKANLPKPEMESIFTEEDFKAFEEEYLNS